jgi:hypothetical protein
MDREIRILSDKKGGNELSADRKNGASGADRAPTFAGLGCGLPRLSVESRS